MTENIFRFNVKFKPVFFSNARYKHIWGGRGRGGSYFGTDYFLFKLIQPEYFRGMFLRAVFSDIRSSLFRDFKDRLEGMIDAGYLNERDFEINETKMSVVYKPTGNSIISKGFKKSSGKSSAKLKSIAGVTHVLIEESEEVELEDFNKLDDSIRTDKIDNIEIILLFNPPSKNHWIIKQWYNLQPACIDGVEVDGWYIAEPKSDPDLLAIHTTYLDNKANLNAKSISKNENYGNPLSPTYNLEFYYRDVKGFISEGAKGRIYKKCRPITLQEFLSLPYPSFYGLDFGYDPDPAALVEIKRHNNTIWTRELIYETELTNQQLAARMRALGISKSSPIYADSAEKKSRFELIDEGFNIIAAVKGPDSLDFGIKKLKGMDWYITEESKNFWFENQEYKWMIGPDGESTGVPVDKHNHLKDGSRYGVITHEMYNGGEKQTGRRN